MNKIFMTGGLLVLLLLNSCQQEYVAESMLPDKAVSFHSSINSHSLSRAVDSSWDPGDKVGIFMFQHLNQTVLGSNYSYATSSGNGDFTAVDEPLFFPNDESEVDFTAYYPYRSSIIDLTYPIDVSEQSDFRQIDFLFAKNLTKRDLHAVEGCLQFYHQLSLLHIQFSAAENTDAGSLDQLQATVSGCYTQADFDLQKGDLTVRENSRATIPMHQNGSYAEAILLPCQSTKGMKIQLSLNGTKSEISLPDEFTEFKAGHKYTFTVKVKNGQAAKIEGEANYVKWRETPVITESMLNQKNISYINHYMPNDSRVRNYSVLYDSDLKMSYWVAYPYCAYYDGDTDRTNQWAFDLQIPQEWQADLSKGYIDSYDRGHQIASADRKRDRESNAATFYYTNMTPQLHNVNSGIWATLEAKVRDWGLETDTIFVVTGASPTLNQDDTHIEYTQTKINQTKTAIPKYYYKALARKINGQFRTIAFKVDHQEYKKPKVMDFALSVAELEEMTGFTFFPTLDSSIKRELNKSDWK